MASPVGHSLAGFLGFILIRHNSKLSKSYSSRFLIILAIITANFPDIDFILGYLFYHSFNAIHRQFTHSFFVGLGVCIIAFLLVRINQKISYYWLVWLWGLYFSHILLDMLAYDSYPPAGVQCFFPFSSAYFAFPISILGGLSSTGGVLKLSNFLTVIQELVVIPLLLFAILVIVNKLKSYEKSNY
ncbi:MAG: metal-dependent hydrolase [Crocosphaera sp.]